MKLTLRCALTATVIAVALFVGSTLVQAADPLPSWNEGPAKQAILDFVAKLVKSGSPDFVPVTERIATFDNDGTLWVEQPIYTQIQFAMERIATLAPQHPEWKNREPYKAILTGDPRALTRFTLQEIEEIIGTTHSGMAVEEFQSIIKEWLLRAKHPRFKRPYTECVYQPMLELLAYLRANEFKTYIVTGGGQEFVRAFAEKTYGVPPEQVLGTAGRTRFEYSSDGKPILVKQPKLLLWDDKTGKPEGIQFMIGRRPVAAFGNSDSDKQMLEWTAAGVGVRFCLIVHHTDAEREYAYDRYSSIGHLDRALDEALSKGWTVVSMKRDWKQIFPEVKP